MEKLFFLVLFVIIGSVGSVLAASLFLLFPKTIRESIVPSLVSYAIGALLGAAFLNLIPEALESINVVSFFMTMLVGIILFFILEKLVIWRHCHNKECHVHSQTGPLILIGDSFHNFVDGVVLASAFLVSIPVGITTGIAIIGHEIPQEVGDFAILLHSGYSRKKAVLYNVISSLVSIPAAIGGYFMLGTMKTFIPYIMAIGAASFLYIAIGDLIPGLQERVGMGDTVIQVLLIIAGIMTILLFSHHH
ncbi:MAG: ZIP family metal transporter [bacterium]|nr:ZIP family metal transporter [bacterium]